MVKNGQVLERKLADILRTGEVPYQAAHSAAQAVDWYDDAAGASGHLELLLAGIDTLVGDLEDFESAARAVQRKAAAVR